MLRLLVGGLAATTLAALGGLHAFWAARAAAPSLRFVVPEVDGAPAFRPTRAQTVAVAAALFTGAALVTGALTLPGGASLLLARVGCGGMALVLTARTVGDFRLVGVFKRTRGTAFAFWDDRAFTPLCAALALASFAVALG